MNIRRYIDIVEGQTIRSDPAVLESAFGSFSANEAKEIGDCAIIAISLITEKSWDEVFNVAQPYFGRYGMNSGGLSRT